MNFDESCCNELLGDESEFTRLFTDGANLDATDEEGSTALILAIERGDTFLR